jgi:putative peptidoglycan lipid II flippase
VNNANKLNTRAAGVVAVAVMCSRVLGLVREVIFSALFGAERLGAFVIAFRVPNLLRDLFAEGALSTAFITVFSKRTETDGASAAWALASKMLTLAAVFMGGVTILGIVFAEPLYSLLAWGAKPEVQQSKDLVVLLTQVMFPFILLVSLAALVMGMLNANNVFGVPAMASSFFNIGSIAGGLLFGYLLDPEFGPRALMGLAIGTLIGGLLQLVIQLPSLRRIGFRFRPDFKWRDAGVRMILRLMLPSVIAASAVQVNVLINTGFAWHLGLSSVTWLNNAFRLMQLPIGIFGVAVATITLPVVSRIAAYQDRTAFGPTLGKALRLAVFLTLPSAVGLYFLARPIISLIYEHGEFVESDSLNCSLALRFYAVGLVGYSGIKVLSPAFYAIDRRWTPMIVSFGSIFLNIGLNWFLIFRLGWDHRGLALATATSASLNFLLLYVLMLKPAGTLETGRFLSSSVRCGIAGVGLGAVCWAALHWGRDYMMEAPLWVRAVGVFTTIGLAGAVYAALAWILRVEAMGDMVGAVRRKLGRGSDE